MTSYLFIDAGCLRKVVRSISDRYVGKNAVLEVDWAALMDGGAFCDKAFYYDAVPSRARDEANEDWLARIEPRMADLRTIRAVDGYHVPIGDLRGKIERQKKVDVMIAVDMLIHTVRRNMDRCVLVAGDVDFQPLLAALAREGMRVGVWHPPEASEDFLGAADFRMPLNLATIGRYLKRPGGLPIYPNQRQDIRPKLTSEPILAWEDSGRAYVVREWPNGWLAEQFDTAAAATSDQLRDPDLRVILNSMVDLWAVRLPASAAQYLPSEKE